MSAVSHFQPALFEFLADLALNNDRAWFQANKKRYEQAVKEPLLRFMADLRAPLAEVAPELVVDMRPVGGSMFRIYRDTRFGSDKTPYKTHASAHFRHKASVGDVHGPGLYLHLQPDACMLAAGIWQPASEPLRSIRQAIAGDAPGWQSAKAGLTLWGEALKRPPAGFDPAHPCIEDLKRKDFVTSMALPTAEVFGPELLNTVVAQAQAWQPFQRFLTRAVGLGPLV